MKYNTNHIFLQVQQRDDYTCLLNRIEELADIKDGEAKQYVILFLYLHSFMYFLYVAMVIWIHMIDFLTYELLRTQSVDGFHRYKYCCCEVYLPEVIIISQSKTMYKTPYKKN